MKSITIICTLLIFILSLGTGCAPEVGSDAWCKKMEGKPKADWSANEAREYAKNCIFK